MNVKLFFAAWMGWALTTFAAVDITTDTTLYADTDWSDQGQVTVAAGATLNLNGHALKVAGMDCAGTIMSTEQTFRYYRFKVEATGGSMMQIGEIKLFNGETEITGQRSGLSWGSECTAFMNYRPDKAFDGSTATKWFDNRLTGTQKDDIYVVVEFAEPVAVSSYQWFTGDDTSSFPERNPTSWRFQGSNDKTSWADLDVASAADCPTGNQSLAYTGSIVANSPKLEFDLAGGGTFVRTGTCTVPVSALGGTLAADVDLRSWGTGLVFAGSVLLQGHRLSTATCNGLTGCANAAGSYQRLAYVESTGTQWIDTGFTTTAETAIDLDFTTLADNGNHAYLCGDWSDNGHLLVANSSAFNQFVFFGANARIGTFAAQTHFRFQTVPGGEKTVVLSDGETGEEIGSSTGALTHTGTGTMMLFAAKDPSTGTPGYCPSSYRLHRFTLTHQGTLVRDLVPVERVSDGKVGLYDQVNKVFYPSAGTEDFVKGTALGYLDDGTSEEASDETTGELYLEVPANTTIENTELVLVGPVRFIKAGAGTYVETCSQTHKGGTRVDAGTLAFGTDARTLAPALTLAGGSLAVTEDLPVTALDGVSVTAPSGLAFTRTGLLGKKSLLTGLMTTLPLEQLTLTVEPDVSCEKRLVQEEGQLFAVLGGATDVAKAVWCETADGDLTKAVNWVCTNAEGEPVADGVPGMYTHVEITGSAALQVPVGTTLVAGEVIVTNYTLTADCDWRGLGAFTLAGTVDLAGHKLRVASLDGTGTVRSGTDAGYRFYRFKVDATGGTQMQISMLVLTASEYFNAEYPVKAYHWNETTFPSQYKTNYNPEKALDGNTGTKWFDDRLTGTTKDDVWITAEYEKPVVLARYQWWTGNDASQWSARNPVAWRLQGSDDNATWTDLDVVTDYAATKSNKALAFSKCLSVNPGGDGSELHVEVAAGATTTLSTVKLAGRVKLVKDGAGTLVVATHGQTYCGGTEVTTGILKPGCAADDTLFGAPASTFTIDDGAQFLDDFFAYGTTPYINWVIAGTGPDNAGAIRATTSNLAKKNNSVVAWGLGLTLADDATISQDDYAFDCLAPDYGPFALALNGHALTLRSAKTSAARVYPYFLFSSVSGTGSGTVIVDENVHFFPYGNEASTLPEATLIVSEKSVYSTGTNAGGRDLTVSNLVYRSTSTLSQTNQTTFVLGSYAPESTASAPKVLLGDATHQTPTLDLRAQTTSYDVAFGGGLTFAEGTHVAVALGTRHLSQMEKILAWDVEPTNVVFTCADRRGELLSRTDGLYYVSGLMVIIR